MAKSTLVLKSTVTQRQAEPVPPDMAERLQQLQHHEAQAASQAIDAATITEPAPPEPEKSAKQLKREAVAVQSAFLAGNLNQPVVIFLVNGLRLTGKLKQFDQFTVVIESPVPMLIFKHAITTVTVASRPLANNVNRTRTDEHNHDHC